MLERVYIIRSDSRLLQSTFEESLVIQNISRDKFGPGKSGERSHAAVISAREIITKIKNGIEVTKIEKGVAQMDSCSFQDPTNNSRCNGLPTGTVNYDVIGDEELVLVCSREHGDGVAKSIEEELKTQGRITVTARNGWGRA